MKKKEELKEQKEFTNEEGLEAPHIAAGIIAGFIILLMVLSMFERANTRAMCDYIIENDKNYTVYLDGWDITDQVDKIDLDELSHYKIKIDDDNQKVRLWKKKFVGPLD